VSRAVALLAAVVIVATVAACGAGGATPRATLAVSDAWIRLPVGADQSQTAAYITIANTGPDADALVGVSCALGGMAAMHQTSTSSGMGGMTGMEMMDRLEIPGGGSLHMAPGGYHIMLTGLTAPLALGQKVKFTLTFEHAGAMTVEAEVRGG
jgi:hypothetical protein